MPESDILRELREQRNRLLARDGAMSRSIVALYAKAEAKIKGRLARLVAKIEAARRAGIDIQAEHPSWLPRQAEYHTLLDVIEVQMQRFGDRTLDATGTGTRTAVKEAVSDALAIVPQMSRPTTEALEHLHSAFRSSPVAGVLGRSGIEAKERAESALFSGLAAGDNPRTVARLVAEAMLEGLHRASNIARTEMLRAYRGASQMTYRENADVVRGWRWICAFNERTCPVCIGMDGTDHPLDEEFASHPSCRCTTVPITLNNEKRLATVEKGSEWVLKQPRHVQDAIYGRTVAQLIRDGHLKPADLAQRTTFHPLWGTGRQVASLRYLLEHGKLSAAQIAAARSAYQ